MHPFFEKIKAAPLTMGWGGGSKWKEGNNFFLNKCNLYWTFKWCSGKGLNNPHPRVFNPWFAAFYIQQYSKKEPAAHQLHLWPPAPPVATSDTDHAASPDSTPEMKISPGTQWNQLTLQPGCRWWGAASLCSMALCWECLVVCNPCTEQESQHTTIPDTGKLRKAKEIKRPQEAERVRE